MGGDHDVRGARGGVRGVRVATRSSGLAAVHLGAAVGCRDPVSAESAPSQGVRCRRRRSHPMIEFIRRSRVLFFLSLAVLTGGCVVPREHPVTQGTLRNGPEAESPAPLDSLVRDVCDKSVVMLGEEPHHGGGHTLEVKSELVQRLIERCWFNAVYFESSAYEVDDLNRRLAAGTSAPEQVADAIGGLWSVSSTIDPLVGYLYAQASSGRIRLAGLDPQLAHATSGYLKAGLPGELVLGLKEPRRSTCADVISRRTNWRYDAEHPDDAAARDSL